MKKVALVGHIGKIYIYIFFLHIHTIIYIYMVSKIAYDIWTYLKTAQFNQKPPDLTPALVTLRGLG